MEGFICFCSISALLLSIVSLSIVLVYVKRFVSIFKSLDGFFSGLGGGLNE